MRTVWIALMLGVVALAGCAGDEDPVLDEEAFDELELEATDDTGIIRGVVLDETVTPIEGVKVVIASTGAESISNVNGVFGFSDLAPQQYTLEASKPGFETTQQAVMVEAGVAEPPAVKILLTADPTTTPFISDLKFEGFIECSFSLVAVGFAACNTFSPNDVFMEEYQLDGTPDFAQSELVWESTQSLGDRMTLAYSAPGDGALLDNYGDASGTSPVMVNANRTTLEAYNVGAGQTLFLRVFNAPVEGTETGDPVNGDDCLDRPVLGGCATGLGATLNQEYTVISHVFYNMVPDEGWRFSADGAHPLPA